MTFIESDLKHHDMAYWDYVVLNAGRGIEESWIPAVERIRETIFDVELAIEKAFSEDKEGRSDV